MHFGISRSLSSPIDFQHRIQPIIDVHAVYDAMQEIVRLSDIEQLCENVTHAEKHTPQNPSGCSYPKIHHDVLNFPSSSFSRPAANRHRTRDVISSISLLASSAPSPDDMSSSVIDESSQTSSGRTRSGFSAQLRSSSLWTLLLQSSPSPAQPSPRCSGLFPLLSDTTKKSLHVSRALNDVHHQWL